MYKGKCCVYLVVDYKVAGVDPYFLYGILKLGSEHVVEEVGIDTRNLVIDNERCV